MHTRKPQAVPTTVTSISEKGTEPGAGVGLETSPVLGDAAETAMRPVIWITGFSASGKTTVGRKVESRLKARGITTVMLDGDDLRSIFAQKWGYSRAERIDLARVYFRLCSHLASQGITVVICAVAMYDEVRDWLREHVSTANEVFLDVPETERRERDRRSKEIYDELGSQESLYDEPRDPDLIVSNYGETTADDAAREIVEYVVDAGSGQSADHGRTGHWRQFYTAATAPSRPSSFAAEVAIALGQQAMDVLEVGCGNGRDASFFIAQGMRVTAIDSSAAAIEAARSLHAGDQLSLFEGRISDLPAERGPFDAVYSRFCLHAMTPVEEDEFLALSHAHLKPGGRLFVECRSINDPLARQGEVISKTERIHGHYRRFVVADELVSKLLRAGFEVDSLRESDGLSPLGDDDPVVIRVHASSSR